MNPALDIATESLAVGETGSGKQYRFLLPGPTLGEKDRRRCLGTLATRLAGAQFLIASGSLPRRRISTRKSERSRAAVTCGSCSALPAQRSPGPEVTSTCSRVAGARTSSAHMQPWPIDSFARGLLCKGAIRILAAR